MKPAHLVALAALGFVGGAVLLSVNRKPVEAAGARSAPEAPAAPAAPSPATPPADKSEPDAAAQAERTHQLGLRASQDKDYDLAISYFTESLRLRPNHWPALKERWSARYFAGQYPAALEDAEELIKLAGGDNARLVLSLFSRGTTLSSLKRFDEAIRDYSEVLRLGGEHAALSALLYALRGEAYRMKKELDRAIRDCSAAIRLDPRRAATYATRAKAYNEKGLLDHAIADCSRALGLEQRADVYGLRGLCYYLKRDYRSASSDGESALALEPNSGVAHTLLSLAYGRMGDYNRALYHEAKAAEFGVLGGGK
jgi:tetratricopeptide (TPR) repeat protein